MMLQCAAVLVFLITFVVLVFFILRTLRRMNYRPTYLPGKRLKAKWNRWNAGRSYGQVPGSTSPNHEGDTAYHGPGGHGGAEMDTTANSNATRVQRGPSTRSTITLPPYSASPKPEEQIIAREGERGGMDVVVEFPETADEEESRRDELMEALYQIRVQRRQENAEREARRQARREARERGDIIRLEELRLQSVMRDRNRGGNGHRARSSSTNTNHHLSASALLAEHQSRGRERRIASVNYAALGRVRHDGSRLRDNSYDSDNRPLLQNAASINEDGSGNHIGHHRDESYSSLVSGSSATSDPDTLTPAASQRPSMNSARSRSNSQPTSIPEEDTDSVEAVPTVAPPPPEYDHLNWGEAPAYTSPVASQFDSSAREAMIANRQTQQAASPVHSAATRNPENGQHSEQEARRQRVTRDHPPALPMLTPLPAIQIDIASPVSDVTPTTPTQPQSREQASERPAENTHS